MCIKYVQFIYQWKSSITHTEIPIYIHYMPNNFLILLQAFLFFFFFFFFFFARVCETVATVHVLFNEQ